MLWERGMVENRRGDITSGEMTRRDGGMGEGVTDQTLWGGSGRLQGRDWRPF